MWMLFATAALAACGLDVCPIDEAPLEELALVRTQNVLTTDPNGAGWYWQSRWGGYVALGPVHIGGTLPLVYVREPLGPWVGLGNAVTFAEVVPSVGPVHVGGGLQVELPTTMRDEDEGHWLLLPYLRTTVVAGQADVRARAGWGFIVGETADHTHDLTAMPTVAVEPHTHSELLTQLEGGYRFDLGQATLRPGLQTAWTQPTTGEATVLSAGAVLEARLGNARLRMLFELPLTTARRFDERVTLDLAWSFWRRP